MAFDWAEDINPGKATWVAGMNEVQTNLDTIYATLGITRGGCASGAGWTQFPLDDLDVALVNMIHEHPEELRAVADYAYENKCPAYNSGYQLGVDTTDETGYNNADLSGYDATHNPGYYDDEHTAYENGDLSGYDATANSGYNPSVLNGYDNADNITVRGAHDTSA